MSKCQNICYIFNSTCRLVVSMKILERFIYYDVMMMFLESRLQSLFSKSSFALES